MKTPRYEESQWVSPWVWVLITVILFGTLEGVFRATTEVTSWTALVLAGVLLFFGAVILAFARMTTRVYDDMLVIRFGLGFTPVVKRIPIQGIREQRAVEYRPLLDAGGWGVRYGRFEGRFTRFYSAHGTHGAFIEGDEWRTIIGSDTPHQLLNAIAAARVGVPAAPNHNPTQRIAHA